VTANHSSLWPARYLATAARPEPLLVDRPGAGSPPWRARRPARPGARLRPRWRSCAWEDPLPADGCRPLAQAATGRLSSSAAMVAGEAAFHHSLVLSEQRECVMWTHRRRLGVSAEAIWPQAGNGLAGGAGAAAGPQPPAADRPCSQPPGHIPRHHRATARALCVPAGPPTAARDPGPGGTGRRPPRPPGRPAAGRPAASTPSRPAPRFRRNQGVA
jgi:hypothetical protein